MASSFHKTMTDEMALRLHTIDAGMCRRRPPAPPIVMRTAVHGKDGTLYWRESGRPAIDRCDEVILVISEFDASYADLARMYGWEIDPPAAPPEKSPQEKALDDFIAKRKAKREAQHDNGSHWACGECGLLFPANDAALRAHELVCPANQSRALDRAMQKLSPHEVAFRERLMPYRGPVL